MWFFCTMRPASFLSSLAVVRLLAIVSAWAIKGKHDGSRPQTERFTQRTRLSSISRTSSLKFERVCWSTCAVKGPLFQQVQVLSR